MSGTGLVGSEGVSESIALSGVGATGFVGSVGFTIPLSGVSATGSVGNVKGFAWSVIDDTQTANWQNIGNTQTAGWTAVSTT